MGNLTSICIIRIVYTSLKLLTNDESELTQNHCENLIKTVALTHYIAFSSQSLIKDELC